MMAEQHVQLPTIDDIRTKINSTIKFHERERYAANLGKAYRNSPEAFRNLINELCKPKAGDIPVVTEKKAKDNETEEEDQLVKILPTATNNVPKKFHLQYAGLMAAVSSNVCKDVLEKEMTESQSVMFKKFIIVNYVKQQKDVDILKRLVLTSVPFVQKHILRSLLSKGRKKALDHIVLDVLKKFGAESVAKFIHGCSSSVVLKVTSLYPDILESDHIDWYRCCKFQPKLIIRELTNQILEYDKKHGNGTADWNFTCLSLSDADRNSSSRSKTDKKKKKVAKSGWQELLKHPASDGITQSILELALKYPRIDFSGYHYHQSHKKAQYTKYKQDGTLDIGWFIKIPTLIWKHQNLFWLRHNALMMTLVHNTLNYDGYGRLQWTTNDTTQTNKYVWWKDNTNLSDAQKSKPVMKQTFHALMQHLLDKATIECILPLDINKKPKHVKLPTYGYDSTVYDRYKSYFKSPFDAEGSKLCVNWDKSILNPNVGIKSKGGADKAYVAPQPRKAKPQRCDRRSDRRRSPARRGRRGYRGRGRGSRGRGRGSRGRNRNRGRGQRRGPQRRSPQRRGPQRSRNENKSSADINATRHSAISKFWKQFENRGEVFNLILNICRPQHLSKFMSIHDMKVIFERLIQWFRSVEPDGKTFKSHLRRIEWCLFTDFVIHRWLFNVHSKVKRYRKQHAFTKKEEKKDDSDGSTVAHGPYDNLLQLVYSTSMQFMKSYHEFPWKLKHNERLTSLNQMYNELRIAQDRWIEYYKKHVNDIPNAIEIDMTRDIRNMVRMIQRYTDVSDVSKECVSDDNDDAYLSDGELKQLNRRMNDIRKTKRIKKLRRKQYELIEDDVCPEDIVIDEEIIERTQQTTTGDADDEYDDDDEFGESDDEIIVEVDYYDTDSVISQENLKNKLQISGAYIQAKERLYKLTEEDIMYTSDIKEEWTKFIAKYKTNISKLEAIDEALKSKEEKTDDGDEDDAKQVDVLQQKIKRKYTMGSFPLLNQFANLRLRMERIIENEVNAVHNLDRFVHVMSNRIFNKCNDLSMDALIENAFKRLEDDDKRPNKQQFGDLSYDFQKNLYEKKCSQWLYYWHSTMRRIMEFSTKRERILEENGYKLIQKLIDRYIAAVHSIRSRTRIINTLNTLKLKVGNRGKNLSNISLVSYTIQCLRRRRVNDDIVISKELAIEMLQYYLNLPQKVLNIPESDNDDEDKVLKDDAYDDWRVEVYKIYGGMLEQMVRFREIVIGIRVDEKRFKKMQKRDQDILEEDIKQSAVYIKMIHSIWSKHLLTHMHAKWDEADQEMQKLYIMTKRNYKSISKLAQLHEKQRKAKEEADLQEQREKEEEEYQKRQTAREKGTDKTKKNTKIKKRILRRRTKAERERFKGSSRLLRGLKSIRFRAPKSPMDVKKLTKNWIKFVNKYIDDIDEIDEETGTLSDAEHIKFKYIESIHAKEFERIFREMIDCVSHLNELFISRDIEYMNHIRSIMKKLIFTPKLIHNIISELVPGMLDINKYIEHSKLRSQSIEVINEAFGILETKRRQIAHTPELAKKLPSLDECISSLFNNAYDWVMNAIDILQKKVDDPHEDPLEEDAATFEDMQDEYCLLAVKIMRYCAEDKFEESFNKIHINNELVEHIVELMKHLNKRKKYTEWKVCWRGIMGVKDELINPDRTKHTAGEYTSARKSTRSPTRSYRGRGRSLYRGRGRGRGRGRRRRSIASSSSRSKSPSPLLRAMPASRGRGRRFVQRPRSESSTSTATSLSSVDMKQIVRTGKSLVRFDIDEFAISLLEDECITTEQKKIIFKAVGTFPHIRFLAKKAPETVIKLFNLIFDDTTERDKVNQDMRNLANRRLEWLLDTETDNTSELTRDKLYKYQDITDPKIRRSIVRKSDSGLDAEREEAMKTLVKCTLLCNDDTRSAQIRRTVQFFTRKLKNESIDRRRSGIKTLFSNLHTHLDELLTNKECIQYILEMLDDCLEVQDLDIGETNVSWHNIMFHKVLKYFYNLSLEAIELAVKQECNALLFDFGVEIQWKMAKYRLGTSDAASQFRIDLGDITNRGTVLLRKHEYKYDLIGSVLKSSEQENKDEDEVKEKISTDDDEKEKEKKLLDRIFFKEEFEDKFVDLYLESYKKRVQKDNEEFMKTSKNQALYLRDLFDALGRNWCKNKVLLNFLDELYSDFADMDLDFTDDDEEEDNKLLICDETQEAVTMILRYIITYYKYDWYTMDVVGKFLEEVFKALQISHTKNRNDVLLSSQQLVTVLLRNVLRSQVKFAQNKTGNEWTEKGGKTLQTFIEHCLNILGDKYPKYITKDGDHKMWLIEWEIHKSFRWFMNMADRYVLEQLHKDLGKKKKEIRTQQRRDRLKDKRLKFETKYIKKQPLKEDKDKKPKAKKTNLKSMTIDYNQLPGFKWNLFKRYWDICLNNLSVSQIKSVSDTEQNAKQNTVTTEKQTTTTILFLEEAKKRQNQRNEAAKLDGAPSLFRNEQEEECWKTEQAVWTVDMIKQWIFGGRWIEVDRVSSGALVTLGVDNPFGGNDSISDYASSSSDDMDLGPPIASLLISGTVIRTNCINKGILKHRWYEMQTIQRGFKSILKSLQNVTLKDNDNLRIIETNHPALELFEDLVKRYHCQYSNCIRRKYAAAQLWKKIDVLENYHNLMLKSRQAQRVIWRWFAYNVRNKEENKTRKQRFESRNRIVESMLDISQSAVHLRFVWKHLIKHRQDLLNAYLDTGETFRGVFYIDGAIRFKTRAQRELELANDSRIKPLLKSAIRKLIKSRDNLTDDDAKKPGVIRQALRRVLNDNKDIVKEIKKEKQLALKHANSKSRTVREYVEQQLKDENKFIASRLRWKQELLIGDDNDDEAQESKYQSIDEIDDIEFDHRDIFCLEGCYDLVRLLPSQTRKLELQRIRQLLNPKRPMMEREAAAKRLTLLPSWTYVDCINLLNEYPKKVLGVKLLEVLIKGCMYGDEKLAPIHYLLSPEMLSSQQARVAAYTIPKCIPYSSHDTFTEIIKSALSGERRKKMKITAYKQMIRLLTSNPTQRHLKIVEREWKRKNVHRDVRIIILLEAFRVLERNKPNQALLNTAWRIIETCVSNSDTCNNEELLIALIGSFNSSSTIYKSISFKPRILQNLSTFKDVVFSNQKQRERMRNRVLLKLAKRIYQRCKRNKSLPIVEDERLVRDYLTDNKVTREDEESDDEKERVKGDIVMFNVNENEDQEAQLTEAVVTEIVHNDDGEFLRLSYDGSKTKLVKRYAKQIVIQDLHARKILQSADIPFFALKCVMDTLGVYYAASSVRDTEDKGTEYFKQSVTQIAFDIISNFDMNWLHHKKNDIHKVNEARYKMGLDILSRISGCNRAWKKKDEIDHERVLLFSTILNKFFDRIEACDVDETELCAALVSRAQILLETLTQKTPHSILGIVAKRCPLSLRNHLEAHHWRLTKYNLGLFNSSQEKTKYFEEQFYKRIDEMMTVSMSHPMFISQTCKAIERMMSIFTGYGYSSTSYGSINFDYRYRPWNMINDILKRTFLEDFEEEDPVLIQYIRCKSIYYVLNNMYSTAWQYYPTKDVNNVYNDAFMYMFRNINDILPMVGLKTSANNWFDSLKNKYKSLNWNIFKHKDVTHHKTKTKNASINSWDDYAKEVYSPFHYPKAKKLMLISDFLQKLLELNQDLNKRVFITSTMQKVYQLTYEYLTAFQVPIRITFGHNLLPWIRVLVQSIKQTKHYHSKSSLSGYSSLDNVWTLSQKIMRCPYFGAQYRAKADEKKQLSRAEKKALQFEAITPQLDEYPFNILNIGLSAHEDEEWTKLTKKVFVTYPLKSFLFLRFDVNATNDESTNEEEKYDAEYHDKQCMQLIEMNVHKIRANKYKDYSSFSWSPFVSIYQKIRNNNIGSKFERDIASKRLKALLLNVFDEGSRDEYYKYLALRFIVEQYSIIMDFLADEEDEKHSFLNNIWNNIVMSYAINESKNNNEPDIPLLLTRLHNKTKAKIFKESKHETDIHPFIQTICKQMTQSFIQHAAKKHEDLTNIQKIERNVVSILIRNYSNAPSPSSLSSEQPRSLGQIMLDYNRLDIARSSMKIQANIVATDEGIKNKTFSNNITFCTDEQSVNDSDSVAELAATLNYNMRTKNKAVKKSVISVVEFVIKHVLNTHARKISDGPLPTKEEEGDIALSVYEKVLYRWTESTDLFTILCRILTNQKTQIESFKWELLFEWLIVSAQRFKSVAHINNILTRLNSILTPNHAQSKKTSEEAQLFMKFLIDTASNAATHDKFRQFCYGIIRQFRDKIELLSYFYPDALRAIIDSELFYQEFECDGYTHEECKVSTFIRKVDEYEKAQKEAERKEKAYLKQNAYDLDTFGDDDDDKEENKEENPNEEGDKDEDEEDINGDDAETTAKMLQKYMGPLTLDLVKYYLLFSSITNTICSSSRLTDYGLFSLIKDQWNMVRDKVSGLVYQTELMQNLMISSFMMIARFPYKWNVDSTRNSDKLVEFASLADLETSVIYDLVSIAFDTMTMSENVWRTNPLLKILNLNENEVYRSRYLQQWYAVHWLVKCAANEAVRQLPFEVNQYNCYGVVFENGGEIDADNEDAIVSLDCINMEWNLRNVVVTKKQLKHMRLLKEDQLIKQDRRPTRMKLENQSFSWLPKWCNLLNEMKKLAQVQAEFYINIELFKQIITEYKSDDERQAFLNNYRKLMDQSCWSF